MMAQSLYRHGATVPADPPESRLLQPWHVTAIIAHSLASMIRQPTVIPSGQSTATTAWQMAGWNDKAQNVSGRSRRPSRLQGMRKSALSGRSVGQQTAAEKAESVRKAAGHGQRMVGHGPQAMASARPAGVRGSNSGRGDGAD